ncbi:hypothetical protein HYN49_02670 [Flavobacterium pallidum]|uniref:T9SS sorting signal type C domain-containing protein n=2 Tax=Flavobacterium pallidum TaxID=2172098 RepID=A0A2S1SEV1_9FLAO|nr:T9SS sorting signal type C domain-containing protein [Flavobacterium pallidum]AWI24882.1 hypothetical protein HYN49_02670 [Flavobacterium pallidum]
MNKTVRYFATIAVLLYGTFTFSQCPSGSVAFFSQAEVDDFGSTYPSCTTINGNLGVYGTDITNLDGLSNITTITGYADFESDLSALTDWSGLDNLTTLDGSLYLYTVNFSVLPDFNNLTSIGGDFVYRENTGLSDVSFPNITTINGYFDVGGNPDMTGFSMPALTSVGSLFAYYSNPLLADSDFAQLASTGGYFYISENAALPDFSGFSSLSSIGSYLFIGDNAILEDISGLNNLVTVNGYIQLTYNNALTSLSGLDNVDPSLLTDLRLDSNAGLATCNVPSLCTYLSNGGNATISGNAIGCLNAAQVSQACTPGCASTTAWNGTSWDNGAPNSTIAAVFTGDFSSTGDLHACTLTIQQANVTINTGDDFIVEGVVSVDSGGSLVVENNANLIQVNDASNTGVITVKKRAMMKRQDYVFWGSPVTGQDLKRFSPYTLSPTMAPGYPATVGSSRFYTLNETTNSFAVIPEPLGISFAEAKGYMVRAPNNFPLDFSQTTFYGAFTGIPNNGDATIAITNTPGTGQGYNMLGNPYPSAIDADLFLMQNPGALYFWTHTDQGAASGANYATYTTFGTASATTPTSAIPDGTIAVGQGFLLKTATSGTATFTNAMRTGNNNAVFFRHANIEKHRIWLNLANVEGVQSQMLVGYMDGATQGVDISVDAPQMEDSVNNISSLIGNEKFAIQALSLPFDAADVIPISFNAVTPGAFTMAIDHLDGLFAGNQNIYIKDNIPGIIHNVKESPYTFTADAGTTTNRFSIVFQNMPLAVDTPVFDAGSIALFKADGVLEINSATEAISGIKVFDSRGRLVLEQSHLFANTVKLPQLTVSRQVLFVRVTSGDGNVVTKKVVY